MRPAKAVTIVIGALLLIVGFVFLVPGIFLLATYGALKDDSGFRQTSMRAVSTNGYALVSPQVDLDFGPQSWVPTGGTAAVRIVASPGGPQAVFVGIGPSDRVAEYLRGVAYDEVAEFGWSSSSVGYRHFDGAAPSSPPSGQNFWVASQEGSESQDLRWEILDGNWTAVIMNADGSAPVAVDMSLGARFDILQPIAIAVTVIGAILLSVGILLVVLGVRRPRPAMVADTPTPREDAFRNQ